MTKLHFIKETHDDEWGMYHAPKKPTPEKIDYRQPHKFESDGTMNDLGKPLCVCGLPYDIPKLHGQIPKKKKKKKKIECMEDCCVQRREFNFSNKVTPEPSEDWEREFEKLFTMEWDKHKSWDDFSGAVSPENIKQFISQLLAQREKELIEKVEKLVRDIAQENQLKIGTSAFGFHYQICSELSKLKSTLSEVGDKKK